MRILQVGRQWPARRAGFPRGSATAVLGLGLHFFIALSAAATFYGISKRVTRLTRHPVVSGILYGLVIYAVMNLVVLPLSANPRKVTFPPLVLATGLFVHMFFIGLPISLAVRGALPAKS